MNDRSKDTSQHAGHAHPPAAPVDNQLLMAKLVEVIERLAPRPAAVNDAATDAAAEYRQIKAILRTHSEK